MENPAARRWAHLGELFRERGRFVAAAEEYGKAHALVGNAYETISNKYALALMALTKPRTGLEGPGVDEVGAHDVLLADDLAFDPDRERQLPLLDCPRGPHAPVELEAVAFELR